MSQLNYITSLVRQVKKQNMLAMRTLYERYAKEMLAASYRITNDKQEAEDILQESFLVSFQKIHQLKNETGYGSWLKQIVPLDGFNRPVNKLL